MLLKKGKVVMLATKQKAEVNSLVVHSILSSRSKLGLSLVSGLGMDNRLSTRNWFPIKESEATVHNLYVICNDNLKLGLHDWVLIDSVKVARVFIIAGETIIVKLLESGVICPLLKFDKIIASNDKRLSDWDVDNKGVKFMKPMPKLSQTFILKYMEGYNKDNTIVDILIEYYDLEEESLCVKFKDYTITIHKVKTEYSREEVALLIQKYRVENLQAIYMEECNTWIEENV